MEQCGCYGDHGGGGGGGRGPLMVCYTLGQCGDDDSHESFASHRYKGVSTGASANRWSMWNMWLPI